MSQGTVPQRIERVREAANVLLKASEEASKSWHPWGDNKLPERSGKSSWRGDVAGYLGGPWGYYAKLVDPWFGRAVAKMLLDSAENMEIYNDDPHIVTNVYMLTLAFRLAEDVASEILGQETETRDGD